MWGWGKRKIKHPRETMTGSAEAAAAVVYEYCQEHRTWRAMDPSPGTLGRWVQDTLVPLWRLGGGDHRQPPPLVDERHGVLCGYMVSHQPRMLLANVTDCVRLRLHYVLVVAADHGPPSPTLWEHVRAVEGAPPPPPPPGAVRRIGPEVMGGYVADYLGARDSHRLLAPASRGLADQFQGRRFVLAFGADMERRLEALADSPVLMGGRNTDELVLQVPPDWADRAWTAAASADASRGLRRLAAADGYQTTAAGPVFPNLTRLVVELAPQIVNPRAWRVISPLSSEDWRSVWMVMARRPVESLVVWYTVRGSSKAFLGLGGFFDEETSLVRACADNARLRRLEIRVPPEFAWHPEWLTRFEVRGSADWLSPLLTSLASRSMDVLGLPINDLLQLFGVSDWVPDAPRKVGRLCLSGNIHPWMVEQRERWARLLGWVTSQRIERLDVDWYSAIVVGRNGDTTMEDGRPQPTDDTGYALRVSVHEKRSRHEDETVQATCLADFLALPGRRRGLPVVLRYVSLRRTRLQNEAVVVHGRSLFHLLRLLYPDARPEDGSAAAASSSSPPPSDRQSQRLSDPLCLVLGLGPDPEDPSMIARTRLDALCVVMLRVAMHLSHHPSRWRVIVSVEDDDVLWTHAQGILDETHHNLRHSVDAMDIEFPFRSLFMDMASRRKRGELGAFRWDEIYRDHFTGVVSQGGGGAPEDEEALEAEVDRQVKSLTETR